MRYKNKALVAKFAERVRKERLKQGLSQEDLAERADVHRNYIGFIERAERDPTLSHIYKIANGLKVRIRDLVD